MRKWILGWVIVMVVLTVLRLYPHRTDILVYGSSPGAVAAAIGAARVGGDVLLISPIPWVGGVMTAGGLSVLDGETGTGIALEFQDRVQIHYGSGADIKSQISSCTYEPKVGEAILRQMLREAEVKVQTGWELSAVRTKGRRITGATFRKGLRRRTYESKMVVDASWNGDLAAMAGCDFYLGQDPPERFGELLPGHSIPGREQCISQPVIIQRYDTPRPVPRPAGYDPTLYARPNLRWLKPRNQPYSVRWYGRLPDPKLVMLNYPAQQNLPVNYCAASPEEQDQMVRRAKDRTLGFVYYLQNETNMGTHWAIADDQFPTSDGFPMEPYTRESRRIICRHMVTERDIVPAEELALATERPGELIIASPKHRAPKPPDSIAFADYNIRDVHVPNRDFPRLKQPFPRRWGIPYGALVPVQFDNLLMGDSNIGSSHIARGSFRLQPSRMRIGQAAGVAAVVALHGGTWPSNVKRIQALLKRQGCEPI